MKSNEKRLDSIYKNTVFGTINLVLSLVLNFLSRKLFLVNIGIEYLSVNQIISNILIVLSFAETGISGAVLLYLYKLVAENDTETICSVMKLYRKINWFLGFCLFGIGACLIPFLHLFINVNGVSTQYIIFIYLLYLFDSSFNYFYSYRNVVFFADQKAYVPSQISAVISLIRLVVQCGVIYYTQNYFYYLIVTIVLDLLNSVACYWMAAKYYPYLLMKKVRDVAPNIKNNIIKSFKSLLVINLSNATISNTDNILISWISTIMVGYCANYISVTSALEVLMQNMYNSLVHSLGNYSIDRSNSENLEMFHHVVYINHYIVSASTICVAVLIGDFVEMIFGKEYLLAPVITVSIILKYYWKLSNFPLRVYRDSNGLFKQTQMIMIYDAVANIIFSIILGKLMGVAGVYYGTVLSDLVTFFLFGSKVVYRSLFDCDNANEYFLDQLVWILYTCIALAASYFITRSIPVSFVGFIAKGLLCIAVFIFLTWIIWHSSKEYQFAFGLLKSRTMKHIKKGQEEGNEL